MRTITRWFLQFFVGGILVAAGLGKSLDLAGFVEILSTYRVFPDEALWPIALTVTAIEWVLGVWLLSGRRLATSALAALFLNAGYAIWMTISLLRGLDLPNCGCYGVFFPQPLRWYSPLENLALVGMCAVVWRLARRFRGKDNLCQTRN